MPVLTATELLSYLLLLNQYLYTTSLVGQLSRWRLKAANCDCKYRHFHRSKLHIITVEDVHSNLTGGIELF